MKMSLRLFISLILVLCLEVLFLSYGVKKQMFLFPPVDSVGHCVGFFFLTWILSSLIKHSLFNLTLCLILYSALTEVGQYYLGFRNGEFRDFIADTLGIGLFVMIRYIFMNKTMIFNNGKKTYE
jgi:VanZ family protein